MPYKVYWDGKPVKYKSLPAARKATLARMSKEWVHYREIYSDNGEVVGEIYRTATDDEYHVFNGRSYVKYALYADGSIKAKKKKR